MMPLDPCDCRKEVPGIQNSFFCAHPAVVATESIVASAVCRSCGFQNSPPPAAMRPVPRHLRFPQDIQPCLFVGSRNASDSHAFDCCHPSHGVTTQEQCNRCGDYEELLPLGPRALRSWAVGVTTAPRTVPTLARTLESLSEAGWADVFVFAEPDAPDERSLPGHVWCPRGSKLGAFSNWYLSLTELVLRAPHADAYFLCQDDVAFCRDMRIYLEDILWLNPSPQVVSPYCAAVHDSESVSGFHRLDEGARTCGALSLIFPNAVARALLCDSFFLQHRRSGLGKGVAHIDSVIGTWCRTTGIGFFVHSPSLCQHLGEHSTLWKNIEPSPRRSASSFQTEWISVFGR